MKTPTAPSRNHRRLQQRLDPVLVNRSRLGHEGLELGARLVRLSDPVRVEVAGEGNQALRGGSPSGRPRRC